MRETYLVEEVAHVVKIGLGRGKRPADDTYVDLDLSLKPATSRSLRTLDDDSLVEGGEWLIYGLRVETPDMIELAKRLYSTDEVRNVLIRTDDETERRGRFTVDYLLGIRGGSTLEFRFNKA